MHEGTRSVEVVHVLDRFLAAAERFPDRMAIRGEPGVTYAELDRASTACARAMRALGVGPGDRVALYAEKSPELVVALLAAWKLRAIYVPIDPRQPVPRALHILADAEPRLVFTDSRLAEELVVGAPELRLWKLEERSPLQLPPLEAAAEPAYDDRQARAVALDELAALLFTSGSTGVPKGVKISHRNLSNFIGWALSEFDLRETDVFANHAGLHFDLSTFDLFAALSVGASVWLISEDDARDTMGLREGIRSHGVSVWYSVPSILVLLLRASALDSVTVGALRYVLFAGEVFPNKPLRDLRSTLPPRVQLYNLYGPTETNVCTFYRVDSVSEDRSLSIPIGRAIHGAELLVLDEGRPVVNQGEIGELFVKGACVTPGYWRRGDTENGKNHAAGVHATGDLVSYEGEDLVYRGRRDRMLKLNGYRVELGEVEAALQRHADVEHACVVPVAVADGTRLVAFCAPRGDKRPSALELKEHCASALPRYMIPHRILCSEKLPRNANGKVDVHELGRLARAEYGL